MSMLEELQLKLDSNATYELTKIRVINSESKYITVGEKRQGEATTWRRGLLVGGTLTSEIESFEDQGDKLIIHTKNSVYTLEKLPSEKQ